MSLIVREPGLVALLVDGGRPRSRSLGVPVGGAADRGALAIGNALVDNSADTLALEFSLAGPTLEAQEAASAVIFGANFQSTLNGLRLRPGKTFSLKAGDLLRIGATPSHARGYLCVAGGFKAGSILGSRSTLEPLRQGDILKCKPSESPKRSLPFPSSIEATPRGEPTVLRVLPGPQQDWFLDDSFFEQLFEVSPTSNRMGVRLRGQALARKPGELVSEAVAPGAVQVTNDGLPVVLGVDGQTIGGYPKIANVIRADLDRLGQLRPRDRVRFVLVTREEAEAAARARSQVIAKWVGRLHHSRSPRVLPKPLRAVFPSPSHATTLAPSPRLTPVRGLAFGVFSVADETRDTPRPFDVRTVEYLLKLMSEHDLSEVDLKEGDQRIRLRKGAAIPSGFLPAPVSYAAPAPVPAPAAASPPAPTAPAAPAAPAKKYHEIKSELVGSFYSRPHPDKPEFVKVGSRVTADTIVCLVIAMKVNNEIKAGCTGTIVEVVPKNEDFVGFGDVLFKVDTDS